MKIVVLGGGLSTERQVSLVTATNVCKALRKLGHQAVFVDTFLLQPRPAVNINGTTISIFFKTCNILISLS